MAAVAANTQTQPKRMTLSAVTRGKIPLPLFVVLYGPEGIGKSSWVAGSKWGVGAPSPVFIGADKGTARLDAVRFPEPRTWQDVIDALTELLTTAHDFKTVVLDPINWLETLIHAHVCAGANKREFRELGWDGPKMALKEWHILVRLLDKLGEKRGMHVVLLAHSLVMPFKNPNGSDYHRYEIAVDKLAAAYLRQRADATMFVNQDAVMAEIDGKSKAIATGERTVYTEREARHDAKNRFNLPPEMPLSWSAFMDAVEADVGDSKLLQPIQSEELIEKITALIPLLTEQEQKVTSDWLAKSPPADKLQTMLTRLTDKLKEQNQ